MIPAYIKIDSFKLSTNESTQGSNSSNITDVWIYANDQLQGIFELPCNIPINITGKVKLSFRPGIKKNGESNNRSYYSFYTYSDTSLLLEPEKEYSFIPEITYIDQAKFAWIENFETKDTSLKKTSYNITLDSLHFVSDSSAFNHGKSGYIKLSKQTENFEYASKSSFSLPGNGKEVYMELNYKTDLPLIVSFYQTKIGGIDKYPSVITINPSKVWKKIYIYLSEEISNRIYTEGPSTFSFFFNAKNPEDGTKEIFLDNIKLIYR